ncbi:MAG: histone deacetylase family protein [Proteobacteria bacterium]|nr:histone deacetylase family protein [Pseudomonadota bacterium]
MTTALYSHDACLDHDPGRHHPERPDRLRAVAGALSPDDFPDLIRRAAPLGTREQIERVHPAAFADHIFDAVPEFGTVALDPDTQLSPGSGDAALRAMGALCDSTDAVINGDVKNAFCSVRPPGHHAEAGRAMGFCLFNNVAVAAHHALAVHGLERVAVVDFDVHHGNGTQAIFENDPNLLYASSHQFPAYPGTGAASETGVGNLFNTPLAPGTGSEPFRAAYRDIIFPAIRNFSPDLLIISAGFDGHFQDPLCQLNLTTEDFRWVSEELVVLAEGVCAGRLVSALEGGYDLEALAESAAVHVSALEGA